MLDAAAEMVGRGGWNALTMKGLAAEAGVSRQLVYDHFEDGTGLLLSTIRHLFEGAHRGTAEVLRRQADGRWKFVIDNPDGPALIGHS